MTVLGINGEATAKWHEVHISPEQATMLGVAVLVVSGAVFFMGRTKKTA